MSTEHKASFEEPSEMNNNIPVHYKNLQYLVIQLFIYSMVSCLTYNERYISTKYIF